jgi:hypothetical protein
MGPPSVNGATEPHATCGYLLAMRRLQHVLAAESGFAELLARRQRESNLEQLIKQALPPMLAARVAVIDARSTELVLAASGGAAAALLRQRISDIDRALAHKGWKFTGIRVHVQARSAPRQAVNVAPKQIDAASIAKLRRLAEKLGDSELAAALRRLVRHAGAPTSGRVGEPLEGVEDEDREQ